MKSFLKFWLPVLLWAVFIFYISSLPSRAIIMLFPGQDIIFHLFEYTILAFLFNRALRNSGIYFSQGANRLVLAILACFIYALIDEFHQGFVPGRISSVKDLVTDSFGIILGSIIYRR